jgi:NitT/TauT family transport system substrate-binding protein
MSSNARRGKPSRRLVTALAASALMFAAACGGDDAKPNAAGGPSKVKVYLAVPTLNTALINLVLAEDLDNKNGLEMEVTKSGAGSTNQIAALRAGEFDFVGTGTATAVDANAEGAGLMIVGGTGGLINNLVLKSDVADKLNVSPDAPVEERIKALRGLTIASSPPGSSSSATLRYLISKAGLDPDKDVEIAPVQDGSAIVAGIRAGKFDGSFFGVGVADANIADGSGKLWISLPRGDIKEFDKLVGVAIVTTQKFANEHPDEVAKFHAALSDAQEMVANDPKAAGESLRKYAFPKLGEKEFDIAWEQARTGYPAGVKFSRESWQVFVDLFQPFSKKDYSTISYEDLVAPPARAG